MRNYYTAMVMRKKKQALDNQKGLTYSTGMSGPFKENAVQKRKCARREKQPNDVQCKHCGRNGHLRTNYSLCLKNKKFMTKNRSTVAEETNVAKMPANRGRESGKTKSCLCIFDLFWY